jgi:hypothetical protein
MSKEGKLIASIYAWVAGLNAYFSLDNLLQHANTKAAVFQEHLSRAPEITEQVYEAALQAANVYHGNFYMGLTQACLAGFLGGLAIYAACSRKKE